LGISNLKKNGKIEKKNAKTLSILPFTLRIQNKSFEIQKVNVNR